MGTPSPIDIRVREFIAKEAYWRVGSMEQPSRSPAQYEISRIAYLPNRTQEDTEFAEAVRDFLKKKAKSQDAVHFTPIEGHVELRVNATLLNEVRQEFQGLGRNT